MIKEHKLSTRITASDKSVVPVVHSQIDLNLENTSSKPQTIKLLLPIWFADASVNSEKAIMKNLDLKVLVNNAPTKMHTPQTYADPTHLYAKLFLWDVKLAPKESVQIKVQYALFMSTVTLNLHEMFSRVYVHELEQLDMGPILGVNFNFIQSLDLELPTKIANKIPGTMQISCDLAGLNEFLQHNQNLISFLQDETASTKVFNQTLEVLGVHTVAKSVNWDQEFNPLRIIELHDIPQVKPHDWTYTWEEMQASFGIEAYAFVLPTTLTGFKEYYKKHAEVYDKKQKQAWHDRLEELYTKASNPPVNKPDQIDAIRDYLD